MNKIIHNLIGVIFISTLLSCSSDDVMQPADCSQSLLSLSLINAIDATSCSAVDGEIAVTAIGGLEPYTFELAGIQNQSGAFSQLKSGNYEVKVTDANTCFKLLPVTLSAGSSDLGLQVSIVPDTDCLTGNGEINASATGGIGPFEFKLNSGVFGTASNFSTLKAGSYTVEVRDSEGCSFVEDLTIERGDTGVSFESQIKPIINTKCAITGCHNGDNGSNRNWTIFSNVKANAGNIKTLTGNRSMPQTGSLTQDQIDLIACWVDDGAKEN